MADETQRLSADAPLPVRPADLPPLRLVTGSDRGGDGPPTEPLYDLYPSVDPLHALLDEISRTAGQVSWLQRKLATCPDERLLAYEGSSWNWFDIKYTEERKHLAQITTSAIRLGIEERVVRQVERRGAELERVLNAGLEAAGLSADQKQRALDAMFTEAGRIAGQHLVLTGEVVNDTEE